MYWLDDDDWNYKQGGNPNTNMEGFTIYSRLNGYDGTVRVYCPEFYIKSEEEGNKRRVWISSVQIDSTWNK